MYIKAEHLPSVKPTSKLNKKYYGPYKVIEKVGPSAYWVKIPASWKVYNVFNKVLLKLYHKPLFLCQINKERETGDQQDAENHENDYEVETLLDSQISKQGRGHGRLEYLVKWKNYPVEESSWEPVENLENT